jgi:type I restriction enzyme, R subunit
MMALLPLKDCLRNHSLIYSSGLFHVWGSCPGQGEPLKPQSLKSLPHQVSRFKLLPIVKDPEQDQLDELLNSVDLSTYGLERVQLNFSIALDDAASEIDPQNPNARGYRGDEPQQDPLDEIIAAFNDRFFSGWDATPEEQRVKFLNIARHVIQHPNFQSQFVSNQDEQNRRIALEQLIQSAINQERRRELDLYKRYASDPEFKRAFDASIMNLLSRTDPQQFQDL